MSREGTDLVNNPDNGMREPGEGRQPGEGVSPETGGTPLSEPGLPPESGGTRQPGSVLPPEQGGGPEEQTVAAGGGRLRGIAEILSILLHPIFMPLYGLLIIFSSPTLHAYIPQAIKRMIFILVLANNVMMPIALAAILYRRGAITTFNARDRNERMILLTFALLMYSLTAFLVLRIQSPNLFRAYFISIAVVTLATLVITVVYKISLHAAGFGGLLVLVISMIILYRTGMTLQMIAVILAGSSVMSARIYLGDHSPAEVWSGFFAGAAIMGLSLFLLMR